jgi:hypothetical protein
VAALESLKEENPRIIKEVRGRGLMVGIEYLHEFMGPLMSDALSKQGIWAAYSGNAPQVMRFMLPLTVSEQEMRSVIAGIRAAVDSVRWLMPLALPAVKVPGVLPLLNDEMVQIRLFGLLRTVEDMSELPRERLSALKDQVGGERGKDLVRKLEPQLQQLVAAMLKAGQAADEKLGPVVRPVYERCKGAAGATAERAAGVAGGAGRTVAEKLPPPIREAGRTAAGAARQAAPAAAGAVRNAPAAVKKAVPAARDAVGSAARTTSEAARKAGQAAGAAAVKAKEAAPQDTQQLRDPDAWGRVAGALGGKLMDGVATGVDAAARGVRSAAGAPRTVRRMVTGEEEGPVEK